MKARKQSRFHTCCGQRIRVRVVDGAFVEQPHKCSDAKDVERLDWTEVQTGQNKRDAA